jgi:two-component system KDP operon response regulator KdpE
MRHRRGFPRQKGVITVENKIRILIIDDEPQMRRMLRVALAAHGYEIREAANGQEGIEKAADFMADIVLLDLTLPDMDGLEVIRNLREWLSTPIIVLSVKEQEDDKIAALDAGADDYITKPFRMGELLARVRAAFRHIANPQDDTILIIGNLAIDFSRRRVTVGGSEVKLTPTEYELLKALAINAGCILTHPQLMRTVWGPLHEEDVRYLRVYIGQLRHKIEADPSQPEHIITEPGVGYRLL